MMNAQFDDKTNTILQHFDNTEKILKCFSSSNFPPTTLSIIRLVPSYIFETDKKIVNLNNGFLPKLPPRSTQDLSAHYIFILTLKEMKYVLDNVHETNHCGIDRYCNEIIAAGDLLVKYYNNDDLLTINNRSGSYLPAQPSTIIYSVLFLRAINAMCYRNIKIEFHTCIDNKDYIVDITKTRLMQMILQIPPHEAKRLFLAKTPELYNVGLNFTLPKKEEPKSNSNYAEGVFYWS
jgi:hypothetical protein